MADIIDQLVGIQPGTKLDGIRAQRQQARDNAQASYLALFQPDSLADMSLSERHAVAVFVCVLHGKPDIAAFYAEDLGAEARMIEVEAALAITTGPYGKYPEGVLSAEDVAGPPYTPGHAAALGPRLAAALAHAHLLVFHPRDAAPEALQALIDAGWSTTGIVTLSQLISFLSFQIRVVVGLRALGASSDPKGSPVG